MRKRVYLDHNIIISAEDNPTIFEYLCSIKRNYLYYYSPAHIEEIYKKYKATLVKEQKKKEFTFKDEKLKQLVKLVLTSKGHKNVSIDYVISLMKCIEVLTGKKDIIPNFSSRKSVNYDVIESTIECFGRVAYSDTTGVIKVRGKKIYNKAIEVRNKRKDDKSVTNMSNLSDTDIWDNHYVKEAVEEFNANEIANYIEEVNTEIRATNRVLDKKDQVIEIRKNFRIKQSLCREEKCSRHEIELAFESLFEILNANGYCKEKEEDKAVSSIHDVSHAIYGLHCDIFITSDQKFYKKLKAVYYYLGIEKEVYYCPQKGICENIREILKV